MMPAPSISLTCTDRTASRRSTRRARRGVAEIELLLSVLVLILILTLSIGIGEIAFRRMGAQQTAEAVAFYDATESPAPHFAIDASLPDYPLPNRTHSVRALAVVTPQAGTTVLDPVTVFGDAYLMAPAWPLNGFPIAAEADANGTLFTDHAETSHGELNDPLLLAPAWEP